MIESNQIILTGVIVLLAFLLLIIGIQVFLILNEFRKSLRQFNGMIGGFKTMTDTATETFKTVAEKSTSIAGLANLVNLFLQRREKKK